MLINVDPFLTAIRNYRVVHLGGRYGSGKTALAFMLAYELLTKYKYRYLFSNTDSVWNDDPSDFFLRDGVHADAVLNLDEAGEYLETRSEVKQWLSYLRKLNVILLLPSFLPPARDVRMLSCQRIFNAEILGLPLWVYRWGIDSGHIDDGGMFFWWRPSEIWGIYDTIAMPSDAESILKNVKSWVAQAAKNTGYTRTALNYAAQSRSASLFADIALPNVGLSTQVTQTPPTSEGFASVQTVVDLSGVVDAAAETARKLEKTVSLSNKNSRGRRR